jgi:hypothetical protein
MMSEMLFVFLSLIILYLAVYLNEKLFLEKGAWKSISLFVLFLLCVVYIHFVRSMGIAMVLAVCLWFGLLAIQRLFLFIKEKRKNNGDADLSLSKRWLLQYIMICSLTGILFFASYTLWGIRQAKAGCLESSYKDVFLLKTDGTQMSTWDDWKTRIKYNVSGNITKWIPNILLTAPFDNETKATAGEWAKGLLIVLVFVTGLFYLRKQAFWIILFYVGISVAVLILYPEQYQGSRYLTPVIPFFIFLFFNGIANIITFVCRLFPRKPRAFIPQSISITVLCFWLYPQYIEAQSELRATAKIKTWEEYNSPKMNNYLEACRFCKYNLPDSIRVIVRKPEIFYMYSGYKKSTSFPWHGEPDTIISYLKQQGATHIILDDWFRHAYLTLYPAVRAYPDKFKVLTSIGRVDATAGLNPTYVLEFNDEGIFYGENEKTN